MDENYISSIYGVKIHDERVDQKADIDSPHFTGQPTAPTPEIGDNSTRIATTEFVQNTLGGQNKVVIISNNATAEQAWTAADTGYTSSSEVLWNKIISSKNYFLRLISRIEREESETIDQVVYPIYIIEYGFTCVTGDNVEYFISVKRKSHELSNFEYIISALSDFALQSQLTFDNAPTSQSNNPVKSGGVYTAINNSKAVIIEYNENTSATAAKAAIDTAIANGNSVYMKIETTLGGYPVVAYLSLVTNYTNEACYWSDNSVVYEFSGVVQVTYYLHSILQAIIYADGDGEYSWSWYENELAYQAEVEDKAPSYSPEFTGVPKAPTPTTGDNSTKIATTAFVKTAIDYAKTLVIPTSATAQEAWKTADDGFAYGQVVLMPRTDSDKVYLMRLAQRKITISQELVEGAYYNVINITYIFSQLYNETTHYISVSRNEHTHDSSYTYNISSLFTTNFQTALTFDNTPTSGSNNPVKSGGVYTAISDAKAVIVEYDEDTGATAAKAVIDAALVSGQPVYLKVETTQGDFPVVMYLPLIASYTDEMSGWDDSAVYEFGGVMQTSINVNTFIHAAIDTDGDGGYYWILGYINLATKDDIPVVINKADSASTAYATASAAFNYKRVVLIKDGNNLTPVTVQKGVGLYYFLGVCLDSGNYCVRVDTIYGSTGGNPAYWGTTDIYPIASYPQVPNDVGTYVLKATRASAGATPTYTWEAVTDAVTDGSPNLITSNGVYDSINGAIGGSY